MDTTIPSHQLRGGDPVPGPRGDTARLLVIGDAHGDDRFYLAACRLAADEGLEGILQLGDAGWWPRRTSKARAQRPPRLSEGWLDAIAGFTSAYGVWMRFIDGNHDAHPLVRAEYPELPDGSGVRPLRSGLLDWADRGSAWEWCGVRFGALGGAYSIDQGSRIEGRSWWPTETITEPELDRLIGRGKLDVLLTHDAPAEVYIPGLPTLDADVVRTARKNRYMVSRAVSASQPSLLLHGHFHVRHTSAIDLGDGRRTRVEGLASNMEPHAEAFSILHLPSLRLEALKANV